MTIVRVCAERGCRRVTASTYCAEHEHSRRKREYARKKAHPRRSIYDSAEWRRVRRFVLIRDQYICTSCGREASTVDHIGGIDYSDPYNPDRLRALCGFCSGKIDGARAHR